jgi:type I restriction-modification system DNA methylase subunit
MDRKVAMDKVRKLVEKYREVSASGKIKTYSEEETKIGFIQPLFSALGWNVHDKNEVTAEEQISGDRVDYGFYLNGRIKFYLEAKKLSADLNREDFAKQAIRYSWNKGVTWAVLTDFEGLIVFNALSPEKTLAGKKYLSFTHEEYLTRFDELWRLSKESFSEDILDKEAEKVGKKLQKISVTETLAKDLNDCRVILTEAFSQWNDKVDPHLIDEGVQKLLNRLIFIRSAEDRKIEPPTLTPLIHEYRASGKAGEISPYAAMVKKFRELDVIYNSNLFDEHPFEKWEEFSGATEKVIDILHGKKNYFEYDFSVIPADVLGNVYENYLGHQLKKSKKEEAGGKNLKKRKEQGIYYTPKFIVDYIVENALGPVLDKCKSISDLQKIKILDPACGSGSFLVAAMNFIIKKYEEFGAKPDGLLKIQILQNNIYGVDLDQQAVELARLNLLLNTFDSQTKLPNLGGNIKQGNSLISGSDKELKEYFGKNYRDKLPFNWQEQFPEVFLARHSVGDGGKQGGFDCVIGNPPYIFARGGSFSEDEKMYYSDHYKLIQYQLNTFLLFIEKGIDLLKESGGFGFIIPNNWLTINSFSTLREYLLKNTADLKIINAVDTVFGQASVDTCVLVFKKDKPTVVELGELKDGNLSSLMEFKPEELFSNDFIINIAKSKGKENDQILDKVNIYPFLDELAKVSTGLKAYQTGKGKPAQNEEIKKIRKFHSEEKLDNTYYCYLEGSDVKRYKLDWSGEYLSYGDWLAEPRKSVSFDGPRILVRQIPAQPPLCINGVYTDKQYLNDINSMVIFNPVKEYDLKYILGVINSRLLSYWFIKTFDKFQRKIFPQFKVNELAKFPIYPADKKQQSEIVVLVNKMLDLNKELSEVAENSDDWRKLKEEIARTDKKIDEEIYGIYGLTEGEIKIVKK